MKQKVWLITGCSTGFGRALATEVLAAGDSVAVTARKPDTIHDIVKGHEDRAMALALDVTDEDEIAEALEETIARFGRIDVLVNNAGIGYFGAIEESDEQEIRQMFEINFFGLAKMTQSVLPQMRKQRSGHIINIASIGGIIAFPGVGYYNATKFAVDGFSESLAKETAPLGIKVTIVAPSGFRTDWAGRSALDAETKIDDYKETAGANQEKIREYSGNQPGDPVRAAKAIIEAANAAEPPLRLLLGKAALKNAYLKIDQLKQDFDKWADTSAGADFPEA